MFNEDNSQQMLLLYFSVTCFQSERKCLSNACCILILIWRKTSFIKAKVSRVTSYICRLNSSKKQSAPWEADKCSYSSEFPLLLQIWIPKFHYSVYKSVPLDLLLSNSQPFSLGPVHTYTSRFISSFHAYQLIFFKYILFILFTVQSHRILLDLITLTYLQNENNCNIAVLLCNIFMCFNHFICFTVHTTYGGKYAFGRILQNIHRGKDVLNVKYGKFFI
jgi:hypothetical protein